MGNPENLIDKQKKAYDLEILEKKNSALSEQVEKLRQEIDVNQKKLPKISQLLQEKIDQAVKLNIDVDPD